MRKNAVAHKAIQLFKSVFRPTGTSMDSSKQLEISISKATPTIDESTAGQAAEDGAAKKNKKDKKKG